MGDCRDYVVSRWRLDLVSLARDRGAAIALGGDGSLLHLRQCLSITLAHSKNWQACSHRVKKFTLSVERKSSPVIGKFCAKESPYRCFTKEQRGLLKLCRKSGRLHRSAYRAQSDSKRTPAISSCRNSKQGCVDFVREPRL